MIRAARFFDIPEIMQIGKKLHEIAITHNTLYDFDDEQAIQACKDFILSEDKLLLVCIRDNRIVGFFWAALTTPLAGKEIIATDVMLFVLPEYQGGQTAFNFIKQYEQWAKTKGAKGIELSVSSGVNQSRTLAVYSYFGYKPQSVTYYKEI